jgi:hypothetical protein
MLTSKRITKKQFVLNQPRDMKADEVIKRASLNKIKLTANAIHSIRSSNKTPDMGMLPTKAEALLYTIASEVGLSRSIELLSQQRSTVQKLVSRV